MMKRLPQILLAIVVFVVAIFVLQPAPSTAVVVAARDLQAGHVLSPDDIQVKPMPQDVLPQDVITDSSLVIGQTLNSDRGQGDVVRLSQLGEFLQIAPGERAIAVQVTDASGMGGLLHPGQMVGVVAIIPHQSFDGSGTFTKATIENLRVLYIDPMFEAKTDQMQPAAQTDTETITGSTNVTGTGYTMDRAREGSVVLAVPVDLQSVFYDFTSSGAFSESRPINALELLATLNGTNGAQVSLYLMPSGGEAKTFTSPGLWLPNLIVTPMPTPTQTPEGTPNPLAPAATATPNILFTPTVAP